MAEIDLETQSFLATTYEEAWDYIERLDYPVHIRTAPSSGLHKVAKNATECACFLSEAFAHGAVRISCE